MNRTFAWIIITVAVVGCKRNGGVTTDSSDSSDSASRMSLPLPSLEPDRVADDDEWKLWSAGATYSHNFNETIVMPNMPAHHAELLARYAAKTGPQAEFARSVLAREYIDGLLNKIENRDAKLKAGLSSAHNRTTANLALKVLLGREPRWDEMLAEDQKVDGGLVNSIDDIRRNRIAMQQLETRHHLLVKDAADRLDRALRVGAKPIPAEANLWVGGGAGAQIDYAGKSPLRNVVVIVRVKMQPRSQEAINLQMRMQGFNQLFDDNPQRNREAAQYLEGLLALEELPQAVHTCIPLIEPGDTVSVTGLVRGHPREILESRVSVYSDAGAIIDKVCIAAGKSVPEPTIPEEKLPGRKVPWKPSQKLMFANLKPGQETFERCLRIDNDFGVLLGQRDRVSSTERVRIVARSDDDYILLGPKRTHGFGLVLVPESAVASVVADTPTKKPDLKGKVTFLKGVTWLRLKPSPRPAKGHRVETCTSLLDGICTKTGESVELIVPANQSLRAVATWEGKYVVFLNSPAADGSKVVLIPKDIVLETRNNP